MQSITQFPIASSAHTTFTAAFSSQSGAVPTSCYPLLASWCVLGGSAADVHEQWAPLFAAWPGPALC